MDISPCQHTVAGLQRPDVRTKCIYTHPGWVAPGIVWDSSHVLPAVAGGRCLIPTKTSLWRKSLFRASISLSSTFLQALVTRLTNPLSLLIRDATNLSSISLSLIKVSHLDLISSSWCMTPCSWRFCGVCCGCVVILSLGSWFLGLSPG
jgi:hypothetical protein